MPFRSQAQRRWAYANKPQMAREWQAVTPKGKLPARVESRGIPPKSRTDATDFKPLSPGPKARHRYSKPAKEQDSMKEGKVKAMPGSRK